MPYSSFDRYLITFYDIRVFVFCYRFDKLLYLGVSEDKVTQLNILKALTRKYDYYIEYQIRLGAVFVKFCFGP